MEANHTEQVPTVGAYEDQNMDRNTTVLYKQCVHKDTKSNKSSPNVFTDDITEAFLNVSVTNNDNFW